MPTFKQISNYLKDNPSHYWFKNKLYGWGWTPATWQGWAVILGFVAFLIFQATMLQIGPQRNSDVVLFILITFLSVLALILICKVRGEKPKWKWGLSKEEKEKYK